MTGKTHAAIGANTIWLFTLTTLPMSPTLIGLAALAALLPDLDASESMIKHVSIRIGRVRVPVFYPFALIFSHLFRHRGWLHSGVAIGVVAGLSWWGLAGFGAGVPLAITLGYASHLIADACTISGIHFFLPISAELHLLPRPLRIRTGSIVDHALFVLSVAGIFLLLERIVAAA